jgi:signal peptidase I
MEPIQNLPPPIDSRIVLYRAIKIIAVIVLVAVLLKLFVFDTVQIQTEQMRPTLLQGDRVLFFKGAAGLTGTVKRGQSVIFFHPRFGSGAGSLRIAALPGDEVKISDAQLSLVNIPAAAFSRGNCSGQRLPPEYSPRDAMEPFRIPEVGASFRLDTLAIRDFVYIAGMIRQENPDKIYALKPQLLIDDVPAKDFKIKDFALYAGRLDSIPDSFSWDRLQAYLQSSMPDKHIVLTFKLLQNQAVVTDYTVTSPFYFLLADDWCEGFDSRYFGPVSSRTIQGRVAAVLWSFHPDRPALKGLRVGRICKITH